MKIGIVGTGNMGRALGLRWARARHEVLFGSRDLNKAGAIAANGSASTQAGDFDAAAAFGDVILYTIRDYFPFNTMAAQVIELDRNELMRRRVSVFLCSDNAQAKSVVKELAEELGFIGVDCGGLERAQLVEAVGDFIRFQIIGMGLGPFATISVDVAQPA